MTVLLGPVPCQGCGRPVRWNGRAWRNPGQWGGRHLCPSVCGAFMPQANERCGRKPGHRSGHRSRYAMDNERLAKSGRAA